MVYGMVMVIPNASDLFLVNTCNGGCYVFVALSQTDRVSVAFYAGISRSVSGGLGQAGPWCYISYYDP